MGHYPQQPPSWVPKIVLSQQLQTVKNCVHLYPQDIIPNIPPSWVPKIVTSQQLQTYKICAHLYPQQDIIPDIPPSWVPKMVIPRDAFDMRCPRGSKLTLYKKCQHEIFALFGDSSRWDGMVEKLVVYEVRRTGCCALLGLKLGRRASYKSMEWNLWLEWLWPLGLHGGEVGVT